MMLVVGNEIWARVVRGIPERTDKPFVMPTWFKGYRLVKTRFRVGEWATVVITNGTIARRFHLIDEGYYFTIDEMTECATNRKRASR